MRSRFLNCGLNRLLKNSFAHAIAPSAAKAGTENKAFIAAVNRCATQKQDQNRVFQQSVKATGVAEYTRGIASGYGCAPILEREAGDFPEPDVHSLLVTRVIVGNHRTAGTRPYNYLTPRSRWRGLAGFRPGISRRGRTRRQRSRKSRRSTGIRLESVNPMAFGFGFNKQKVLSAAEKFVQQGKLQNAIAEYEKILKHDEKDLTVNNTIGDLYARLGDAPKPSSASRRLAMPMPPRASRSRASPCTRRSPSSSPAWMDL